MFDILYKYLILHNRLSIPGVGVFVIEHEPAKLDLVANSISAPLPFIRFKLQPVNAEMSMCEFVASEMSIAVSEAIRLIDDFSFNLKRDIQTKKWVELPELGILSQGVRDEIKFKSAPVLEDYYPALTADKITPADEPQTQDVVLSEPSVVQDRHEQAAGAYEVEETKPRDWWWLYALILALVAGGAILYYYYFLPQQ